MVNIFRYILISFGVVFCFSGYSQNQVPADKKLKIEEYFLQAQTSERNNDFNQAAFYYTQAANISWSYFNFQNTIEYFKKALEMTEKLGNQNGICVINTNLGMIHSELKEFDIARSYFMNSLEASKKLGRKLDIASSLYNIGNTYFETDNFNEAISFLEESRQLALELTDTKILRACYSLLTTAYDKTGDRKKSTEYFNLFAAITKKIQEEDVKRKQEEAKLMVDSANIRVSEISSLQQATKKELDYTSNELKEKQADLIAVEQLSSERQMQIDLLSKERKLQLAEIEQQRLMRNVYLTLIISFIIISVITTYGYYVIKKSNKLLKEKNIQISKQKDEIAGQAMELKDINALKDKLFSIISHDLRSPLFTLIGMLKVAKEGHLNESEQKEFFDDLSKNVEYNTELLENLLKWANTQLKGSMVNQIAFDLFEVAKIKTDLYAKSATLKGVSISNRINKNTVVYADRDMVEIVVRNLLTNAIKYSESGDKITLSSTIKNNHIEVCVADQGVGITSDIFEKLFSNQIITSRGTKNEKGTGLGLILCKDFIKLNGGKIWAESEVNNGSKFFFTLPLSNS